MLGLVTVCIICISLQPSSTGASNLGINTPPIVRHKREWRLTENEKIGSVVDRITAHDADGDDVTISLSSPSSGFFSSVQDGYRYFTIDSDLRVVLVKSLKGLAGQEFVVGIKSSDGTITSRSDAKVVVTEPNALVSHATSFANAFAPSRHDPRLVTNIPDAPDFSPGGPPLLNLDHDTVWEVNSTSEVGFQVAQIEAHDISNTYLKFDVFPADLVHISREGLVTVANNLTDMVGPHKLKVTATNQHGSISEIVLLDILGPGNPSKKEWYGDLVEEKKKFKLANKGYEPVELSPTSPKPKTGVIFIQNEPTRDYESRRAKKEKKKTLTITLIVIGTILPIILFAMFFYYKYKKSKLNQQKRKSLSVEYRGKQMSLESLDQTKNDVSVFNTLLTVVGMKKRVESQRYVETRNQKSMESKLPTKLEEETPTETDEWEYPRHKLRFVNKLGEGCFGQVWKCETSMEGLLTNYVAVKTLKESSGYDERKDLLQELKVLKSVGKHPNVVSLLGCCTEKDPIFMIMEYMINGTLQNYLRSSRTGFAYNNLHGSSGTLTPRDLTSFALQIAKGMDFLSKNFVIHRDLAARNVLVGEDNVCKVSDFGFARDVANNHVYERKSDGRLPIRWMAPESLFDNIFTSQSDVWSFGVLLWEIVTLGSTPYPGKSASDVATYVKSGFRLEKPAHCHREIYNIMYYCWDADPSERLTFPELITKLDLLISNEVDYIALDNFPERDYYNCITTSASGELL